MAEERTWPKATAWIVGIVAVLAILATSVLSLGLAAIFWVPLLVLAGFAMITVWAARRRRQLHENRDANEVRDPTHAEPRWPEDVTDDRLPEPEP